MSIETSIENLKKYIETIATKLLHNKVVSEIVSGRILEVNNDNTYSVVLSGSNDTDAINAKAIGDKNFLKNDYVYLICYLDGTQPVYCVYDTAQNATQKYLNLTLNERFKSQLNYSLEMNIEINQEEIINKIKQTGCFKIQGGFSTNEDTSDHFGLVIQLRFDDGTIIEEPFDETYVVGQPKKISNTVMQERVIIIDSKLKDNLISIKAIPLGSNFRFSQGKIVCGTLLNINSVFSANLKVKNNKNYFSPDEYQDEVEISVQITQNEQILQDQSFAYYWVIQLKEDEVQDRIGYPTFIENNWKCLNSYLDTTMIEGEEEIEVRIWEKTKPYLLISESQIKMNKNFFPYFINKIKCFVVYNDILIESNTIDIYNYYQEKFSAQLIPEAAQAVVLNKEDSLRIDCKIFNENEKNTDTYNFNYVWYKIKSNKTEPSDLDIVDMIIMKRVYSDDSNKQFYFDNDFIESEATWSGVHVDELERFYLEDSYEGNIDKWYYIGNELLNGVLCYIWEKEESDGAKATIWTAPASNITPKDERNQFINSSYLIAIDKNDESIVATQDTPYYEMGDEKESLFCQVYIKNDQFQIISLETTNILDIISYAASEYHLISKKEFKYYIATNMSVSFTEATENNEEEKSAILNGDWTIEDSEPIDDIEWTDLNEDNENIAYTKIKGANYDIFSLIAGNENKLYYVYYTERVVWIAKDQLLREDNWSYPKIAREVEWNGNTWNNSKVGTAIEQINTFNQLTNNGKSQGIFYDKTAEDDKKLYINASFINTGTLRVGDEGQELFYANIQDSIVKIGGFNIDNKWLYFGENGSFSGLHSNPNEEYDGFTHDTDTCLSLVTPTVDNKPFYSHVRFYAGAEGHDTPYNAKFAVLNDGSLYAEAAQIQGKITATSLEIASGATVTGLATSKQLTETNNAVTNAQIAAENAQVTATGAQETANTVKSYFIVDDDYIAMQTRDLLIYSNKFKLNASGAASYNPGYFEINTDYFKVSSDGEITATGGMIGNWVIANDKLFSLFRGDTNLSAYLVIKHKITGATNSADIDDINSDGTSIKFDTKASPSLRNSIEKTASMTEAQIHFSNSALLLSRTTRGDLGSGYDKTYYRIPWNFLGEVVSTMYHGMFNGRVALNDTDWITMEDWKYHRIVFPHYDTDVSSFDIFVGGLSRFVSSPLQTSTIETVAYFCPSDKSFNGTKGPNYYIGYNTGDSDFGKEGGYISWWAIRQNEFILTNSV